MIISFEESFAHKTDLHSFLSFFQKRDMYMKIIHFYKILTTNAIKFLS